MQSRFVSLWFKNLDIDWLIRKRPDLRGEPVAFQTTIRNKLAVISFNDLARQAGINIDTSIADTKFLCPKLQVFDYDDKLSSGLLNVLADWCFRYTPNVAMDGHDGIMLDVAGCTHLLGSEQRFLSHIVKKFLSFGYHVRGAMADTPGAAWAVARYGHLNPIVPTGEMRRHLAPLPIQCLRLSEQATNNLNVLGLRTVEQLYRIPGQMLLKRYSKEVVMRLNQALGHREEFLEFRQPAPDLSVRLDILETVSTADGIALAAAKLIDDLCSLLDKHRYGVREMHLYAYRIDGNLQTIVIRTASPTRNPKHLNRLIKEKLGNLEPGLGFELFILAAYTTNPLEAKQNQLLPDNAIEHRQATLEMIDRIATKIGANKIMRFVPIESHWPTRAYMTKIASDKAKASWPAYPTRPTRLLEQPVEIQVMAPIPDYPPKMFRYNGKAHHIRHADGPERIEGEWWLQNHETRDYFRLEDKEGRRYWIYRSGHYSAEKPPRWFLHGFL